MNEEETFDGDTFLNSAKESEEEHFHSTLMAFLTQTEHDMNELVAVRVESNALQAQISSDYAVKAGFGYEEALRRLHSVDIAMQDVPSLSSNDQESRSGEAMRKRKKQEVQESRAERDLWSLLDILCRAELLVDINNDDSVKKANEVLDSLTPDCPSSEVHKAVLYADQRAKKGRVLCEWLEYAAGILYRSFLSLMSPGNAL